MYLYTVICFKSLKWVYLYLILYVWSYRICAYMVFIGLRLFDISNVFILLCLTIKC